MRNLPKQSFFKNKRVLVRVDFNIELKNRKVIDDFDILRALKTIKYVSGRAKYTLLISHLGNPGEGEGLRSLRPVGVHLSGLLRKKVYFVFDKIKDLKNSLAVLPENSIVLLENIRFYSGEYANGRYVDSMFFAKELASLGDCYINEAFGESHRRVSTVSAITNFLPSFAGFNFQDEIKHLDKLKSKPLKPLALILGGAKMKTKLPLIKSFIKKADYILLGGAIANTFLKARGFEIGKSLYEKKFVNEAKKLLKHKNIILPTDYIVAMSLKSKVSHVFKTTDRQSSTAGRILDIGPESLKQFREIIKSARTIIWNGPMGYYENQVFAKSTKAVAKEIFVNKRAFKVIGGGDSTAFLKNSKLKNQKSKIPNLFISTGGGSMLEYLAGKNLPGVKVLS
ncbi:MAG: phosphoglycerate kinase [Candidatus Brennerbacteria bacterium RIFOXYC1_FULL_41_11]|uniref:Phosphoglycerate kinase n=1 Tax=Candidatus Brennerbacteria bacterium RIFOXYD1_FULL_41_16 TaxID=1797529 RepID=A0A1G1XJV0_9BACT|nr:MAG: Phosphoglycerate kinase [Parcubacteria group bacterium GW2011_GWB1_41_4]OGY38786.1 MAG: phosphoglycerate kinase [Candidatus Brennerbacteria bacterium RIFOXYB1_FULL_41_13]OGY39069.1 MAG: phosphoglycerate kinase [Candidatus Brennerbacteria bacterium RIFOXYC1_FULL_41_11]OGY40222.1 MAG: phosphoglycerate kinase [Candidatus Brennerbacteria bacterium RIFOXYD1_FULL_41_16]